MNYRNRDSYPISFLFALALNLLKGILERSRTSFNGFRTSAGIKAFLIVMCGSLSLSAESVRLLQQAEINKKITGIEKKIVRDNRIKIGLQAVAQAQSIY